MKRQARNLKDDNKLREFNRTMLSQMATLQEMVKELTTQNQKLSAQLWSLHKQDPSDGHADMSPVVGHVPNQISDYVQVGPDSVTADVVSPNAAGMDNAAANMGSTNQHPVISPTNADFMLYVTCSCVQSRVTMQVFNMKT